MQEWLLNMIIIYAPNLRHGTGGYFVTKDILHELGQNMTPYTLITNQFFDEAKNNKLIFVKNILSLLLAKIYLWRVLIFNSRAKIINLTGHIPIYKGNNLNLVLFQNSILFDVGFSNVPKNRSLIYLARKIYFLCFYRNVDLYLVQTEYMAERLRVWLPSRRHKLIKVLSNPVPKLNLTRAKNNLERDIDFLILASDLPHKALKMSFQAFMRVVSEKYKMNVVFCCNSPIDRKLLPSEIQFIGNQSQSELFELYQRSKRVVVASITESLSLPMYEAAHFGCTVMASDRGFAIESGVVDYFFEPTDEDSLHTAIIAVLSSKSHDTPKTSLLDHILQSG